MDSTLSEKFKSQSPAPWPPAVGTLAITLDPPRGYCVIVTEIIAMTAEVRYLDEPNVVHHVRLDSLIPTGKTPADLIAMYELDPMQWDDAIDNEMSMPDFTAAVKSKSPRTAKPKPASMTKIADAILKLTPEQLTKIADMLKGAVK